MSVNRWADEWERSGRDDPYYAVLSADQNRGKALDPAAAAAFWESGEREVTETLQRIEEVVGHPFAPRRVLEIGCGVGRQTIPLARRSTEVVAIDIAPSMLRRAREHTDAAGLSNVRFALSDDALSQVSGTFDFVHSFIVFQHIPPSSGYQLFEQLLARLTVGGFGCVHVTYDRRASVLRRVIHAARQRSRAVNMAVNVLQRRPARTPMRPMFKYDRSVLASLVRNANCAVVREEPTAHGEHRGAVLLFVKQS